MISLSDYTITDFIQEGAESILVRAVRLVDQHRVAIKALRPEFAMSRKQVERLRNEFEICRRLTGPHVPRAHDFIASGSTAAIVFDDFLGQPLDRLLGAPLGIKPFLGIVIHMALALEEVHSQGFIHKNIKPQNIIVNTRPLEVRLINFTLASPSTRARERAGPQDQALVQGPLAYLSPEQVGRPGHSSDNRSDIYSLGVILYEMLTGKLPFEARDPLEWVHAHLARIPEAPSARESSVPAVLSDIVMKCLAKAPEDRYQGARALRNDLERCLLDWEESKSIRLFRAGEGEPRPRVSPIERLFCGRQAELQTLKAGFVRAVAGEEFSQLILVSGPAGIGKTALVHEFARDLKASGAFFAEGKADQYRRDAPYALMAQAFDALIRRLLTLDETGVESWRRKMLEAIGDSGRLLTNLLPMLELIIGPQQPVPHLPPVEISQRFNRVFLRFAAIFANAQHPLVLFLDDLQWADVESLKLLRLMMSDWEARHFLAIGAYMDNGADALHPLSEILASLPIVRIELGPLSAPDIDRFTAELLHCDEGYVHPLASLALDRAQGNPLFIKQFLTELQDEKLLRFDMSTSRWRWDLSEILARQRTDNLVDLMIRKLQRLPLDAQRALSLAAFLGPRPELRILEIVLGRAPAQALASAERAELIAFLDERCVFTHDRVQQAAYSLLPQAERPAVHWDIARLLLKELKPSEIEERLFEILDHLNAASLLIKNPVERIHAAEWNLKAGRKAMKAAAFASAGEFYAAGMAFLPGEESWNEVYSLACNLWFESAQCEWSNGRFDEAERLLDVLLPRLEEPARKACVHRTRVMLSTIRGDMAAARDWALSGLKLLGMELEAQPSDDELRDEIDEIRRSLSGRPIESLIHLPVMSDPNTEAAVGLLASLFTSGFSPNNNFFCMLFARITNLSLKYGNANDSVVGYVFLGAVLVGRFGLFNEGHRFARLACDMVGRLNLPAYRALVMDIFGAMVNCWTRPLRTSLEYIEASIEFANQGGDLLWAAYARFHALTCKFHKGDPLDEVLIEAQKGLAFVRKTPFADLAEMTANIERFAWSMTGSTNGLGRFDGGDFSQEEFERTLCDRFPPMVGWYWVLKIQARFIARDFEGAYAASECLRARETDMFAQIGMPDYQLYRALSLAALWNETDETRRAGLVAEIKAHQARFQAWSEHCPENFEHCRDLITAEIARIEGCDREAMRLYERALKGAAANGFTQREAVSCEVAARYCVQAGWDFAAHAYLTAARNAYVRWGAHGKVSELDRMHPGLVEVAPSEIAVTFEARPERLDMLAAIKASQTISSEILQPKLQETLMRLMLESAGAQRGWLLCRTGRDHDFSIAAHASIESKLGFAELPETILNYVRHTRESVILDDAPKDNMFAADPYFQSHHPRSVLCLPILKQGEVLAVLYLEHGTTFAAFTAERLAVLRVLASQAAISLENAHLYQEAQNIIHIREDFLSVASHELRTPLTPLKLQVQSLVALANQPGGLAAVPPERLTRLLRSSSAEIARLSQLLDNFLDVSRITAGQMHFSLTGIDLSQLVRGVTERYRAEFSKAGSHLDLNIQPHVDVMGDAERLEQVLSNLLTNALKYGMGKPVEVELSSRYGQGILKVRDRGVGISREQQARIFERFDRGGVTRNLGGLGLGLYITREILRAQGGSIRVESEPGKGACFIVEMPLAQAKIIADL